MSRAPSVSVLALLITSSLSVGCAWSDGDTDSADSADSADASTANVSNVEISHHVIDEGAALSSYPEINFDFRPSYLGKKQIALTFDDCPDWHETAKILDTLRDMGVRATFFVNVENWSNLEKEEEMRAVVRRVVDEGHELGSHTASHADLNLLGPAQIEMELTRVERVVASIFEGRDTIPQVTLFRAPYGHPYQWNDPSHPSKAYQKVAPIVAKHAVEVGWAIDSKDFECPAPTGNVKLGDCMMKNMQDEIDAGKYGPALFHAVYEETAAGLPRLIQLLWNNGYDIISTEQIVHAKYGKSSAELVGRY